MMGNFSMPICFQSIINNTMSGLLKVKIFMENFDEIAFRAEDIYSIRLEKIDAAFPTATHPGYTQFYKAYDGVKLSIKGQANNRKRSPFCNPTYHNMSPFDRLIAGSDIVAFSLIYNDYIDVQSILQYSNQINAITIYVPYQEYDSDKHRNILQYSMINSDEMLTIVITGNNQ